MKQKYQEVEAKYSLKNPEEVLERIESLGIPMEGEGQRQIDTYYTSPARNFLENEIVSEWLRVRETEDKATLNYKLWLPVGAKIQNQCKEYESEISDAYAVKQLLLHLSFREIAVVDKLRRSWLYKNVEISMDTVRQLGSFIELEYTEETAEDQIENINDFFEEVLSMLHAQVGERDRRGYAYALIQMGQGVQA